MLFPTKEGKTRMEWRILDTHVHQPSGESPSENQAQASVRQGTTPHFGERQVCHVFPQCGFMGPRSRVSLRFSLETKGDCR